MVKTDSASDELPAWSGTRLKTACGRHFSADKISISDSLNMASRHWPCSHMGCRKGLVRAAV